MKEKKQKQRLHLVAVIPLFSHFVVIVVVVLLFICVYNSHSRSTIQYKPDRTSCSVPVCVRTMTPSSPSVSLSPPMLRASTAQHQYDDLNLLRQQLEGSGCTSTHSGDNAVDEEEQKIYNSLHISSRWDNLTEETSNDSLPINSMSNHRITYSDSEVSESFSSSAFSCSDADADEVEEADNYRKHNSDDEDEAIANTKKKNTKAAAAATTASSSSPSPSSKQQPQQQQQIQQQNNSQQQKTKKQQRQRQQQQHNNNNKLSRKLPPPPPLSSSQHSADSSPLLNNIKMKDDNTNDANNDTNTTNNNRPSRRRSSFPIRNTYASGTTHVTTATADATSVLTTTKAKLLSAHAHDHVTAITATTDDDTVNNNIHKNKRMVARSTSLYIKQPQQQNRRRESLSSNINNNSGHSKTEDGANNITTKKRQKQHKKKGVKWKQNVRVQVIQNLGNYTRQEKYHTWWSPDDYTRIEDECDVTASHMDAIIQHQQKQQNSASTSTSTNTVPSLASLLPYGFCDRGLENWTMDGEEDKEYRVQTVIDTVWQAQIEAWENIHHGSISSDAYHKVRNRCWSYIGNKSIRVSSSSIIRAHQLAIQDEKEIQPYLHTAKRLERARKRRISGTAHAAGTGTGTTTATTANFVRRPRRRSHDGSTTTSTVPLTPPNNTTKKLASSAHGVAVSTTPRIRNNAHHSTKELPPLKPLKSIMKRRTPARTCSESLDACSISSQSGGGNGGNSMIIRRTQRTKRGDTADSLSLSPMAGNRTKTIRRRDGSGSRSRSPPRHPQRFVSPATTKSSSSSSSSSLSRKKQIQQHRHRTIDSCSCSEKLPSLPVLPLSNKVSTSLLTGDPQGVGNEDITVTALSNSGRRGGQKVLRFNNSSSNSDTNNNNVAAAAAAADRESSSISDGGSISFCSGAISIGTGDCVSISTGGSGYSYRSSNSNNDNNNDTLSDNNSTNNKNKKEKKKITYIRKSKTKIPTSPVSSVCESIRTTSTDTNNNINNSNNSDDVDDDHDYDHEEESLASLRRMMRSHMSIERSDDSIRRRMLRSSKLQSPKL